MADAEGLAAMGPMETLAHAYDITAGLGLAPPKALSAKVVARLFPSAPHDGDPWKLLLWATGRGRSPRP